MPPPRLLSLFVVLVAFSSARARDDTDSSLKKSHGPPTFFLRDEGNEDGLCLSGKEFKRCGLDTLWFVTGKAGKYSLHKRPSGEDFEEEEEDVCLAKARCHADESAVKVGSCGHCGAKGWNILGDSETGHVLSQDKNKYCIKRSPNSSLAVMGPCEAGYTFLTLEFATTAELNWLSSASSRFISAAWDGELPTMKKLVNDVNVNVVDPQDNMFPLLAAATKRNVEIAEFLLSQQDILVNQVTESSGERNGIVGAGWTALMVASTSGDVAMVRLLMAKGGNANMYAAAEDSGGPTPLWLAASQGHSAVVAALLEDGSADPSAPRLVDGITPLMAAAAGGHADTVRRLIAAGADVHARDKDGVTALLNVAESGDVPTLQLLLAAGADVDVMSNNHFSPLIVASAHGHFDCISALLDAGAKVEMPHPDGVSALMYAAANGKRPDAVGLLLAKGAEVDRKHAQGGTALIEACTSGNLKIVEVLLAFGADVNTTDADGVTALISAAASGHVEVIRRLLAQGVAVNATAHSGGTALMYAAGQGQLEACRVLLEEGHADAWVVARASEDYKAKVEASVAAGDPDVEPHVDGVNALLIAIDGGYNDIARLLLGVPEGGVTDLSPAARAGLTVKDEFGGTALTTAMKGNNSEMASLMLLLGASPNESYRDSDGNEVNLLMKAVSESNVSLALELIEHGADCTFMQTTGNSSVTVLLQAALLGHNDIVQAASQRLLASSEETLKHHLRHQNDEGMSPLMGAIAEGHDAVTMTLLALAKQVFSEAEMNLFINQADKDGTTLLMAASAAGNPDVVQQLVDLGADLNAQNEDGHTALMFAFNGQMQEKTLLRNYHYYIAENMQRDGNAHSAEAEQPTIDSISTLIRDAIRNHEALISVLIARGADQDIQDKEGRIARDFGVDPDSLNQTEEQSERNGEL